MKYSVFAKGIEVVKKAGVYDTELQIDNRFSVDITVETADPGVNQLNYELLVEAVMWGAKQNFQWLEEWAQHIQNYLQSQQIKGELQLVIHKHHPDFASLRVSETGVAYTITL